MTYCSLSARDDNYDVAVITLRLDIDVSNIDLTDPTSSEYQVTQDLTSQAVIIMIKYANNNI